MPYRVEISPNARAGCKNTECKNEGIKIQKGELRFGTLVTIQERTSWAYKHWGCVTPQQIANVSSELEGDMTNLDGYEELPKEIQEKVARTFKQGHVDDEDWRGDVEVNRPGQKGFRVKTPKKKTKHNEDEVMGNVEPESPTKGKAASKKRTKQEVEHEDEEAPKPKKARGKAKKAAEENDEPEAEHKDEEAPKPKKARGKAKKATEENDEPEAEHKEEEGPKPKKARGKAKKAAEENDEPEAEHKEEEAPKPKKGRGKAKKAIEENDEPEAPPPKKQRGRPAKAKEEDEVEPAAEASTKSKAKGKKEKYTSIFGPQNPSADDAAEGETEKPKMTEDSTKKVDTPAEPAAKEPTKGKKGAKKTAS